MKALVLSLFIAFSGSIASAACASSQASLAQDTNPPRTHHVGKSTNHVAQSNTSNSSQAGNAD